jgi:hypothetical protein
VTTYVSSDDVIEILRSRGLHVEVVLTQEQVQAQSEKIARETGDGGGS